MTATDATRPRSMTRKFPLRRNSKTWDNRRRTIMKAVGGLNETSYGKTYCYRTRTHVGRRPGPETATRIRMALREQGGRALMQRAERRDGENVLERRGWRCPGSLAYLTYEPDCYHWRFQTGTAKWEKREKQRIARAEKIRAAAAKRTARDAQTSLFG